MNAYQYFDERRGRLFPLYKYSDFMRLCYYHLKSERLDILENADMFLAMQGIHEKSGIYCMIACSINSEEESFPVFNNTNRMECGMMGFLIKPAGENKCSVVYINNKKIRDRVPSVLPNAYDWDRGHFLEKIEK
jgi:hypothetical protein